MTAGLSTVNLANALLNTIRNTSFAAGANVYIQLHTGDPGANGTANVVTGTNASARKAITWSAASNGAMALSNTPSWTSWDGGAVTLNYVSLWNNTSAGTFWISVALSESKAITNGDTFTLSTFGWAITPLAA